jgi:hypothetical protein
VEPMLNQRWSSRRVLIKDRQGELAARFQCDHGRPPTPVEALQLAQQATLETRDAKHEPRSLTEQRTVWHAQAAEALGGPDAVQAMINKSLDTTCRPSPAVHAEWVTDQRLRLSRTQRGQPEFGQGQMLTVNPKK